MQATPEVPLYPCPRVIPNLQNQTHFYGEIIRERAKHNLNFFENEYEQVLWRLEPDGSSNEKY